MPSPYHREDGEEAREQMKKARKVRKRNPFNTKAVKGVVKARQRMLDEAAGIKKGK